MRRTAICLAVLLIVSLLALAGPGTAPAVADGHEAPGAPPEFRSLSAGSEHSCAILQNARVKCWGSNFNGQLGHGGNATRGDEQGEMGDALATTDLGTGRTAVAVSGGFSTSCAVLDDGTVKCWGVNGNGQLGQGDTDSRGDQGGEMGDDLPAVDLGSGHTAEAVAAGNATCAVLDDASLKCWGLNNSGNLGLGDTEDRGDEPGEMGADLPTVDLGSGRTVTAVTTPTSHTCALLDDGTVKCWGFGSLGRLGYGDMTSRGDGPNEMGANLPTVDLGSGRTATAVVAGNAHTCALLDNATVKCWGANTFGQLGLGNTAHRGDHAGEMGDALPTVDLGAGRTAAAITVGFNQTCALLDNGTVKCWGFVGGGALGNGSLTDVGDGPNEMGDHLAPIDLGTGHTALAISAGNETTCALLEDHTVKCWGDNFRGQLGVGDANDRGDGPGEMGDALPIADLGALVVPAPAISVTVTPSTAFAAVGQQLGYQIAVTNTGGVPLTGVTVLDTDVPACAGVLGELPAGDGTTVSCGREATIDDVGVFSHVTTVDSDQTEPVASAPGNVTVNVPRPDARIRLGNGGIVGNDLYNTTAAGQARSTRVPNRGTATFRITLQNDGVGADTYRLSGPGSTNRYVVTYKLGATNITAGVVAGTRELADVPQGAVRTITVTVRARRGTPVGSAITRKLTVTSVVADVRDTVKLTVTRRR